MSSKADENQDSPTHYTSLRWIVAFGDTFFDANMEWVKRHDPVFGPGSYGYISRFVPVQLFVMHKQLQHLKSDGWKSVPEFAGFVKAVNGVSPMGKIHKGGKEFFERLPNLFLERFENTFREHTKKWCTVKTLPIIIAGHPRIAKAYLRWLFNLEQQFPNEVIELEHHHTGQQQITVNISECLIWLINEAINNNNISAGANSEVTEEVRQQMLENPLLVDLFDDLKQFAECTADDNIDMLDSKTWEGKPYKFERAEELIWNAIAPRAAHQQRVENLVQTAGHLGKTHVEEERRSARAKIHSIFYRDFKIWALDIMRKEDEEERARQKAEEETERASAANGETQQSKKKRKKLLHYRRKVDGKKRLELHAKWIDLKLDEIEDSIAFLEEQNPGVTKLVKSEMSLQNKSSRLANEETLDQYNRAATSSKKNRAVESQHLVDITPWMEGSVILSYLVQKEGARPYILAEIKHRGIKYTPEKPVKEMTKEEKKKHEKKWDGASIARLKTVLRNDEHRRLGEEEGQHLPKYDDVKNVKPLSLKLQEWMPIQWQIYKKRKGQVQEQAPDA